MKMRGSALALAMSLFLVPGLFLVSCGGSGSGQGSLVTTLADSFTEDYKAVYVTIDRVDVHLGGYEGKDANWRAVAEPGGTYNLLDLVNGVRETLGIATLYAGTYTQMRLIIGTEPDGGYPHANFVVDANDDIYPLEVPSGFKTGVKVVGGFEILTDGITELILDFDAMRSVVQAGSSGNYLLKPTVSVLDTTAGAVASGSVTDGSDPLEGARTMA